MFIVDLNIYYLIAIIINISINTNKTKKLKRILYIKINKQYYLLLLCHNHLFDPNETINLFIIINLY